MIKILLIDDHQVLLDSLRLLFNSIENVEVVGTLNDSRKVSHFLNDVGVDILVSDLHMPFFSGIDLALQFKKTHPNLKILLLTMAEDAQHIREALRAGVHGYILKKTGKEELHTAILKLMDGKKYYSEAVIEELAATADEDYNDARPETIEHLTAREVEILKLITQEQSTAEIAEKLFISISTVETHRANLMKKLNVKSAIGMVKFAIKHGLVD
ncbi:Oxygen regulatory protein NreC [Emticicia aquatica]|uniref:Oxygen regulatory protein NreC n=1 Tax=Emticicia aquatica TaxID=1681835 RepID=A0ABN8EYY4_9BACT|nr:response regulator transcription factor [Emticicia aquatica]CAH0997784.1 Oxygen regulatory protein NreC [Emticicia aquatica]